MHGLIYSIDKVVIVEILNFELWICLSVLSPFVMFLTYCWSLAATASQPLLEEDRWQWSVPCESSNIMLNTWVVIWESCKILLITNSSIQHPLHCSFYWWVNQQLDLKSIHSALQSSICCLDSGRFQRGSELTTGDGTRFLFIVNWFSEGTIVEIYCLLWIILTLDIPKWHLFHYFLCHTHIEGASVFNFVCSRLEFIAKFLSWSQPKAKTPSTHLKFCYHKMFS